MKQIVNLYSVKFQLSDWYSFVVAPWVLEAREMFWRSCPSREGDYDDIEVRSLERDVSYDPGIYSGEVDNPSWVHALYKAREEEGC
jgi:hypothetical protein